MAVRFTRRAGERIRDTVRAFEREARGGVPGPGTDRQGMATWLRPFKAPVGGIAARSGATPGSATCTVYEWNGTAFTLASETQTVRNPYQVAVGPEKFIWATWWSGSYWVVTEECPEDANEVPEGTGSTSPTPSAPTPSSPTPTQAGTEFPIPPSTGSDPLEGGGTVPGNPDGIGLIIQPDPVGGVVDPNVPPGTPITILQSTPAPPSPAGPGGGTGGLAPSDPS